MRSERVSIHQFKNLCGIYLPEPFATFAKSQADMKDKKKKGKRFSSDIKEMLLYLYYLSPKAYNFCAFGLGLPSPRTVQRMTEKWDFEPGLNPRLFNILKKLLSMMSEKDRICTLSIDEMSIKSHFNYDRSKYKIVGLEDLGKEEDQKRNIAATYATVIMAHGVYSKWKQPLAYFFVNSQLKTEDVKVMMVEAIKKLEESNANRSSSCVRYGW